MITASIYLIGFAVVVSAFMVTAEIRGWFNLDARELEKRLLVAETERDAAAAQRDELLDMWVADSKRSDHYLGILAATIIRHGGQIRLSAHETQTRHQLVIGKPDERGDVIYRVQSRTGAKP